MTQFNPENKDMLTFGELLDPAMKITDQADAASTMLLILPGKQSI